MHIFEPSGVWARDLRECLTLQLKERDRFDPAMAALIDNLRLLARRDFVALKRACAASDEDLCEMIPEVKGLTRRPGRGIRRRGDAPVAPDVLVPRCPRQLARRVEQRDLAAAIGQPDLSRWASAIGASQSRRRASRRLPADRQLAGEKPRPARQDHPQSGVRDRPPAGRLPHLRGGTCGR